MATFFVLCFCLFLSSALGCSQYVAVSSQTTSVAYRATYTYNWGIKRRAGTRSYTMYHTMYSMQLQCCSGYGPLPDCPPICSSCNGINQNCTSPNNCVCLSGWTGLTCTTDIDECSQYTDQCDDPNGCINHAGTYSCQCTNQTELLASDGLHCLAPVTNIHTISRKRNIVVLWTPPVNYATDGVFSRYKVTCNLGNVQVLQTFTTISYVTISPLLPFTEYNCCVYPQWTTDAGPSSCINTTTLQDAPSDSPSVSSMTLANSSSLLIQWTPPNTPNGIISHYTLYINYTNGSSIDIRTIDSQYSSYLLEGMMSYQLVGVSMSATTNGGSGPLSEYVFNRTRQTAPGAVSALVIKVLTNSSVNVTWHPPSALNGIITGYHINIVDLSKDELFRTFETEGDVYNLTIDHLEPFIPYVVDVSAATVVGKGEIIQKIFFTEETTPYMSPNFTAIRETISNIKITWIPLTLKESMGFVTNVTLALSESFNVECSVTRDVQSFNVTSSNKQHLLSGLEPAKNYCVSISANTIKGRGEYSEPIFVPVYENTQFSIYISGMQDCANWIETETSKKMNDIISVLVRTLSTQGCSCSVTEQYFINSLFQSCSIQSVATFKASLIGQPSINSSQIVNTIEQWVQNKPLIVVNGLSLRVVYVCVAKRSCFSFETSTLSKEMIVTLSKRTTTASTTTFPTPDYASSSNDKWLIIYGGGSGGAIIGILLLTCLVTGCIYMYRWKQKSLQDRIDRQPFDNVMMNASYTATATTVARDPDINRNESPYDYSYPVWSQSPCDYSYPICSHLKEGSSSSTSNVIKDDQTKEEVYYEIMT